MLVKFINGVCKTSPNRQFFTNTVKFATREPTEAEILRRNKLKTSHYLTALGVVSVGLAYAAVPLYRVFCQATSYGGTVGHDASMVDSMRPVRDKEIRVIFTADTAAAMTWNFKPQQKEIKVAPGETALAFYTATNPTDRPIVGISTYNVVPFEAGQYFNKIQCFCFEEQQLNPHEQVDMPVFFYIDPEFAENPLMENLSDITLSYTFFEAKKGFKLPVPSYVKPHTTPSPSLS